MRGKSHSARRAYLLVLWKQVHDTADAAYKNHDFSIEALLRLEAKRVEALIELMSGRK